MATKSFVRRLDEMSRMSPSKLLELFLQEPQVPEIKPVLLPPQPRKKTARAQNSPRAAKPAAVEPSTVAQPPVELDVPTASPDQQEVFAEVADTANKPQPRGRGDRLTHMRARTIPAKRLTAQEKTSGMLLAMPSDVRKPRTRADCAAVERPCPFVSCKHNLYLDVNPLSGSIKLNFPDLEVWEMKDSCTLDVADRDGITLEEVGEILNLTRERIRQVEVRGLLKLKMDGEIDGSGDLNRVLEESTRREENGEKPLFALARKAKTDDEL